jgi:hypothetical protein
MPTQKMPKENNRPMYRQKLAQSDHPWHMYICTYVVCTYICTYHTRNDQNINLAFEF